MCAGSSGPSRCLSCPPGELGAQPVAGRTHACPLTALSLPSCWLSLEGGLLYAFVGPAAAVVLVQTPPRGPQRGPGLHPLRVTLVTRA